MSKIDLKRVQEFCNFLFPAIQDTGSLPADLSNPLGDYERPALTLLKKIEHLGDVYLAYLEWSFWLLKDAPNRSFEYAHFVRLQKWLKANEDLFDAPHLAHLKNSMGSRIYSYLYYQKHPASNVITVAEAERRWEKTNLRGNAQGRLTMWKSGQNWLTTEAAMRATFGPERK